MKSWSKAWKMLWAYGILAGMVNVLALGTVSAAEPAVRPLTLLAFGDSLTAGYNLPPGDAFPVRLEAALAARGYRVRVINAGLSGDTSAGGKARLDWTLGAADAPDAGPDFAPDFAIVELGANDALRGLDPQLAYANLDSILATLRQRKIPVLLAGMLAPRNLGAEYVAAFDAIYPRLQSKYGLPLYPFFLEGVAMHPDLTLPDGLHPNPRGVERIVQGILPAVESLLGPPPGDPR